MYFNYFLILILTKTDQKIFCKLNYVLFNKILDHELRHNDRDSLKKKYSHIKRLLQNVTSNRIW